MAYVDKLFNQNFLEYASYVIKDRAIPHIIDGLKPVQRRILHSLIQKDDGKFHKVANIVGHCMQFHPHGDASIYGALVNIAQKGFFIETQGNFGNIFTGDEASAARYIECRINNLAKEVFDNKNITQYIDSYDGRNSEPVVFPAKIPVILLQGAEGIAVGMSTKILPHNFIEVLDAVASALRGETFQLLPDFPTGGEMDAGGYQDGNGVVLVRAKLDTSDEKKIVIRDLPFGATTASLISSIENAAKKGKIKIAGISDFTTENVEIEIKLPRGVYTKEVVDALYAFTDCQISHSVNLLVIRDETPTIMTVTEVILYHAQHLVQVLKLELEYEQKILKDRLHARTLEQIFIEERIYKRIEEMKTKEDVSKAVLTGFEPFMAQIKREITDEDLERLLAIPIRRISLFDINKFRKEIEDIKTRLKEIKHHLEHLTEYALGFVEDLKKRSKSQYKRLTAMKNFKRLEARDVAMKDKKLRYDKATGFLGYELTQGEVLMDVSAFDRVVLFHKEGFYKVMGVPEKTFVGKTLIHVCSADKDELAKMTFSLLYKNPVNQCAYIKRFQVEGFILEKQYDFLPEKAQFLKFTPRDHWHIALDYKQKPLLRVLEETFPLTNYLVKGVKAGGVRISPKEIESARFTRGKGEEGEKTDSVDSE